MATWALFLREIKRFYRDRSRIVGTLMAPLALFGFIAGGFAGVTIGGVTFSRYLLPGTLALSVMMTAIFSTISIIDDRKAGFLQGVLVAPISRAALIAAKVCAGAALSLMQAALVLLPLSLYEGGIDIAALPLLFVALAVTGAALTALGFALAWFSDSTQGYHAMMNGLLMPMWALSGSLFPADGATPVLATIVRLNPLTPFVALLRDASSLGAWLAPLAWTAAFFALALLSTRRSARAVAA
ncbi:MAG: ABC transporter permease [Deltaproteobacteria bacterium]|nr:ABC transporter permease [Deltaproteobacteria bacterium]